MSRLTIPRFTSAYELALWIRTAHWVSERSHFFDPQTMKFFDSRLATYVFPFADNTDERQQFTVVVSNRYRDLRYPEHDGPRVYRVVLATIEPDTTDPERWHTTADYLNDVEHTTSTKARTAARKTAAAGSVH